MTKLATAFNNTTQTTNGMVAFNSTMNACLDFFYQAGASRGKDISALFQKAVQENPEVAVRTLLWLRDARQGAGERKQFRDLIKLLDSETIQKLIPMIPELGRWDDLLEFLDTEHARQAAGVIAAGLNAGNGLCAKWMPRNNEKAAKLRKVLGITSPKAWRKLVVSLSDTVEQKMCAKKFDQIDFEKVPSVAAIRYSQSFSRNAGEKYAAYKASLEKGEAKINAGAVYPYDVLKGAQYGVSAVAEAQWKALPDFMEGCTDRVLPVVDVSGSMLCPAGGYGSKSMVTCMDVAVSIGLYVAQRNVGSFKNVCVTFSESPSLFEVSDSFADAVNEIYSAHWGMSTNLELVFTEVLNRAKLHNVPEHEMPNKILILSDMQFNECIKGTNAFKMMQDKYAEAGYELPQVVFWNISSSAGNVPVLQGTDGTALVSGFSPSILKSLLKGSLEPVQVMLDTVMVERYNFNQ